MIDKQNNGQHSLKVVKIQYVIKTKENIESYLHKNIFRKKVFTPLIVSLYNRKLGRFFFCPKFA